jgi:hypothetical protein
MTSTEHSVVYAVLQAVATCEGIDEAQLTPPLYEVINTDALRKLFADGSAPVVQFEYRDYTIVVNGPDDIDVHPVSPAS